MRKYETLFSGQRVVKSLNIYENENVGNYCIQAQDDVEAIAWYGCGCPCPPGQTCPSAVVILPFDLNYNVPIKQCVIDSVSPPTATINCNSAYTNNGSIASIILKDRIKIGNVELVFEKCLVSRKFTPSRILPDTPTTGIQFNQGTTYYVVAFYSRVVPPPPPPPWWLDIDRLIYPLKGCVKELWKCYDLSESFPEIPPLGITRCKCDFRLIATKIGSMKTFLKSLDLAQDQVKVLDDILSVITKAEDNVVKASKIIDSIGTGKLSSQKKEKARQAIRLLDEVVYLIRNAAERSRSLGEMNS